ncbi:unnamed protein product [Adineta steineri]|uniref:Kinesin-like protein n=1 Tax=Adineta steineri TaxID=433720 RepID=A0A819LZG2_9BILA|nr:unnamed protein product [Adineta steineri]CAF1131658.1 unnamed protein product [Adineta steineri]CAF3699653.1 unnamed protein product [Adineta steineri]CAF3970773.1 unnamed protein product [Adineta steineri]
MSTTVDPLFGLIQVSTSIKIKRSDGRVHLAKVVQLSPESKSVGVEWNEHGEVKGKEILLDLVFELNNELRPNTVFKQPSSVNNQQVRPTAAVNLPASGVSSSRLTLDIDTLEREYNSRPPPTLPTHLLQKIQQHPISIQTTSTPLPPPPANNTNTTTTTQPKTSYLPSGTNLTSAIRSIRRPAAAPQTSSSVSKIATPSSPIPTSTPIVEPPPQQPQPQLQIPPPTNNKIERRLSRLHVVQQSSSTNIPNTIIPTITSEPPTSIGLHGPFGQMILDYRSTLTYSPILNSNPNQQQSNQKDLRICVAVRKRPLNKREIAKKDNDVITIPNKDHCLVHVPKSKVDLTKYLDNQTFKFDYTFDEKSSNELIYRYTAAPLIDTIFNGGNATVFAYGQTGSGKTFTMGGDLQMAKTDYSHGIYAQTARDIFQRLALPQHRSSIEIFVTFYEIYCGKVFDLLNNKKRLRVLEDQKGLVQVCDRKEQQVKSVQDVLNIIQNGMNIRTSGTTAANANSSRSHAILQIILKTSSPVSANTNAPASSSSSSRNNNHNNPAVLRRLMKEVGKMSLIDLAGSERGKDTASGDRLQRMEGSEINKSLLALKECIRALGRGDGCHVPFRGSTLTKVLRDSFIGDKSKVCMIAMVSPTHSDVENTMNTLRYADRVKELRAGDNRDVILNEDDENKMDGISQGVPIDDNKENRRQHHHHHYPPHHDGSASSNDSTSSSSNDLQDDEDEEDDEQNEALASYAAQVEHLQEYEEALFDSCQDILINKEPMLTKQLRTIVKQAQDTVDYDQEKFVNDMRTNLDQRQQILNELQTRLQAFADCLQQEEEVATAQRNKKQQQQSNGNTMH